ncbi:hypothetical protein VIGAN_06114000 [Vigna angularis var. angularis]|uniref:Uncharacterized protein n=1 Tax=Vigna angularis var. angularis TaxID=157739 RepID=A0A0S3SAV0_PHAAN|nr:hypothetical protein VIGAN_06114000 [Vigna angularis var. angularis]
MKGRNLRTHTAASARPAATSRKPGRHPCVDHRHRPHWLLRQASSNQPPRHCFFEPATAPPPLPVLASAATPSATGTVSNHGAIASLSRLSSKMTTQGGVRLRRTCTRAAASIDFDIAGDSRCA